jgi:hypothetical protein
VRATGLARDMLATGRAALVCGVLAGSLASCSLEERDLAAFENTATGPEKLRAVLTDKARPSRLRADAALHLLDLERPELNGREALFADLKRLPTRARNEIVPVFQTGLMKRMLTGVDKAPQPSALHAKDAGVELLPLLGQREREQLGSDLLGWIVEDLDLRADEGVYSLEVVAERLGPAAVGPMIDALGVNLSPKNLRRVVQIIDGRADAPQRARAAVRLVQVEQDYRSPRQRRTIEAQLKREGNFAARTEASLVDAQIDSRRDEAIRKCLLPALGRFSDQPAARARLVQIAEQASFDESDRAQAFTLLQGRVDEAQVPALVRIALDDKTPLSLRELALERAGETRSRELLPSLLVLTTDHLHQGLRQKAAELLLEVGGPSSLQAFFRALPRQWNMDYPKSEIEAYSERVSRFPATFSLLLVLGEKLHSVYWWNRVIALRYFAARGTAEDAWRIRQHLHDTNPITGPGWPAEYTVGHEAEGALALALERFRRAPPPPSPAPARTPAPAPAP